MTRLGLAIVPWCRGTGAPLRRTQAPPGSHGFQTQSDYCIGMYAVPRRSDQFWLDNNSKTAFG